MLPLDQERALSLWAHNNLRRSAAEQAESPSGSKVWRDRSVQRSWRNVPGEFGTALHFDRFEAVLRSTRSPFAPPVKPPVTRSACQLTMQTLAALESHLNTLAPISLAGWRPRAALLHDGQCRGSAEAGLRAAAAVLAAVHLAGAALPALAHVPLSPPAPSANRQSQALRQIGGRFAPAPQVQRAPDPNTHQQVQEALALLRAAADASAAGEWEAALTSYSSIVQRFPDFAVAEYARIGRALILFQLGRSDDAILQLRDEEVALRGRPEVHAALAAMLWASGRPAQRLEAERQWEVASEFDGRYARPDWVAENKHWPPLLLDALRQFLALA